MPLCAGLLAAGQVFASSPDVSINGSTVNAGSATLSLQSSSSGTGDFTLLPGAGTACGTGTQTKNGLNSTGCAAYRRGSLHLVSNTAASYTVRNLGAGTAYTICFSADNDGSNLQATAATANLTTSAMASLSNSTWGVVGIAGFSTGTASYTSLAFAPDGTPYLAYSDDASSKATVMKFDGSNWVLVGSAGFSTGGASDTSLAFAPDGTPYLAYKGDGTRLSKYSVFIKFQLPGFWLNQETSRPTLF